MKYTYREPLEGVNNPPTNHLKEAAVLAFGLAVIVVGLYVLLGLVANALVDRLSPAGEKRLAAMISIPVDPGRRSPDEQEAQRLLDSLLAGEPDLQGALHVKIACSPRVNAVALPGGTVLLFSGLGSRLRSENELAMVLGHEAGHFAARDHLKGLGRTLVLMAVTAAIFRAQDGIPGFLRGLVGVTSLRFSREQEEAADGFGARLVNGHYGHAAGVAEFFQNLETEEHRSEWGAWLSTHPAPVSRIERLQGLIEQEGWKRLAVKPFDGLEWAGRCREQPPPGIE